MHFLRIYMATARLSAWVETLRKRLPVNQPSGKVTFSTLETPQEVICVT